MQKESNKEQELTTVRIVRRRGESPWGRSGIHNEIRGKMTVVNMRKNANMK